MIERLKQQHPALGENSMVLMADKGLDSGELNRKLWDEYRIKAVIDTRALWREEKEEQGRDPKEEITRSLVGSTRKNASRPETARSLPSNDLL